MVLALLDRFSAVVAQGMAYASAKAVRVCADAMCFQGVTLRRRVTGSGASFSGYVFNLITGHSEVEVRDVLEEFYDGFRGHSDVYEERGEGEPTDVGQVTSRREGLVQGLYARRKGCLGYGFREAFHLGVSYLFC